MTRRSQFSFAHCIAIARAAPPAPSKHHAQIAQIDRELLANRARESFAVGVEAAQFAIVDLDRVDRANALRAFFEIINKLERGDFVRNGQVHADEIQIAYELERLAQFAWRNLKARVLHVDLAMLERGVLHLRRERMRDRIAEDAETNRRIDIARCLRPILKIGERVNVFR